MNAATKAVIFRPQSYFPLLKTAFFHTTPVLERKRHSSSSAKSNAKKNKRYSKKFLREHQEKIRRAVEELKREREEAAAKKAKEAKEAKENLNKCKQGSKSTRKSQFGYDDKDFDFIFRSLFGVHRGFDYSIYEEEERRWWYHPSWFSDNSRNSWRSKYRFYDQEEEEVDEEEEEGYSSSKSENSWRSNFRFDEKEKEEEGGYGSSKSGGSVSDPIESSHRETLGLSPWAPLKLEDVKHAYRTCALKWHPDRHDVSTKAEAEAKFKLCTVAYQSLVEKLQSTKIS